MENGFVSFNQAALVVVLRENNLIITILVTDLIRAYFNQNDKNDTYQNKKTSLKVTEVEK